LRVAREVKSFLLDIPRHCHNQKKRGGNPFTVVPPGDEIGPQSESNSWYSFRIIGCVSHNDLQSAIKIMKQRRSLVTAIGGMLNVLLGMMAGIAATLSLVGYFAGALVEPQRHAVYGAVNLVTAVLGISSGVGLLRFKSWARWGSVGFAAALLLFAGLLALDGQFQLKTHCVIIAYPFLLAVLLATQQRKRDALRADASAGEAEAPVVGKQDESETANLD